MIVGRWKHWHPPEAVHAGRRALYFGQVSPSQGCAPLDLRFQGCIFSPYDVKGLVPYR